jgi:recombination protein RecT
MGNLSQATQGQQLQRLDPKRSLKAVLEKSWPRIQAVMPREMNGNRLYQMYVSTINREPELANCSVESVLSCFMKCTSLGLEPSNVNGLGMAYLLPYGNKNHQTGQKDATLIIGYKGMIELARRSGEIRDISARAVHEGDEFSYSYGLGEELRHVPCDKPGRLTYVYMVANFKDGGHYFNVMSLKEVEAARNRSKAGQRGPWVTDFEAMAKKTVIRRSFPFLPVSVAAQSAAVSDETTPDYSDVFRPVIDDEPQATIEAAEEAPAEAATEATREEEANQ